MLCLFSGLQIPGGSLQLWIFTAESSCACFIHTLFFVCGNFSCVCLWLVDAVDNLIAASVASGFGKQYQWFLLYLTCRWCQIGLFLPIGVSYCKTVGARFLIFMKNKSVKCERTGMFCCFCFSVTLIPKKQKIWCFYGRTCLIVFISLSFLLHIVTSSGRRHTGDNKALLFWMLPAHSMVANYYLSHGLCFHIFKLSQYFMWVFVC